MNRDSTYCFLINCASNNHKAESIFRNKEEQIRRIFGKDTSVIYVGVHESISEIAKKKSSEYSHIIACGGDGTVNRVANGLVGSKAIMGVLPLGSGNDFAGSIGIKGNLDENLTFLQKNQTQKIDLVQSNRGCFTNTFGIGIDGLTNYYASKLFSNSGKIRYLLGGLTALTNFNPFDVIIKIPELDRRMCRKVWMVAVANGKTEGGRFKISPNSINSDGCVEIVIVKDISRLSLIFEFIKLSIGMPFRKKVVDVISISDKCEITTENEVLAHADGEKTKGVSFNFEVLKQALPVVVNPSNYT